MTDYPPIPDGVNREIMLDPELVAMATRGAGVFYALPRIVQLAAPILWREWTCGRAVVELPAAVGSYGWDWSSPLGRVEAWTHRADGDLLPRVTVGHVGDWPADIAEQIFLAGLAAVRKARELAAESIPGSPVSAGDTTGGES